MNHNERIPGNRSEIEYLAAFFLNAYLEVDQPGREDRVAQFVSRGASGNHQGTIAVCEGNLMLVVLLVLELKKHHFSLSVFECGCIEKNRGYNRFA